jgi:serine/threonine protein kinase
VRRILRDLAVAIEELHARGEVRGELCPSNILIQGNGFARISTADMVTILGDERIGFGDFRVDRESLAYMTPERFYGRRHTALSDQFSLGLIALELLGGSHVLESRAPRTWWTNATGSRVSTPARIDGRDARRPSRGWSPGCCGSTLRIAGHR